MKKLSLAALAAGVLLSTSTAFAQGLPRSMGAETNRPWSINRQLIPRRSSVFSTPQRSSPASFGQARISPVVNTLPENPVCISVDPNKLGQAEHFVEIDDDLSTDEERALSFR